MNESFSITCVTPERIPVPYQQIRKQSSRAGFLAGRFILLGALCAAPLAFGAVEPWGWPVLTLLALAALGSWAVGCIRQGQTRIFWSPLYGLAALFLTLGLVQFWVGITPDRVATRNALILLATDCILFFLTGQLFAGESPDVYRQFGQAVTIFASALGLLAIFQAFSSHGLIYWTFRPSTPEVFGPYVNRNNYAGLMEMLIPVAAAYGFTRRAGDPRRHLALFGVAIAVASLLLSGSRGGMTALLAETAIFLFLVFHQKPAMRRRYALTGGALALAAGITLSIWISPGYISARMMSVASLPVAPQVTLGQRLIVTRDTLHIFRDHPWLGTGLGSFLFIFPRYQSFASDGIWEHAHDDYAEALAETGLTGGLLLLAGLILFLRAAFGRLRERLRYSSGWIQLGCALGCCGLLVHSFVDFNLHIPANAAWFAACMGLAIIPAVTPLQASRSSARAEME